MKSLLEEEELEFARPLSPGVSPSPEGAGRSLGPGHRYSTRNWPCMPTWSSSAPYP